MTDTNNGLKPPHNLKPRTHSPKTDDEVYVYDFIGKRIRLGRRIENVTLAQLAGEVGVRFQQIQKWEVGLQRIPSYRLHRIAVALNKSHQWFFPARD